jgi:hypothetical protein
MMKNWIARPLLVGLFVLAFLPAAMMSELPVAQQGTAATYTVSMKATTRQVGSGYARPNDISAGIRVRGASQLTASRAPWEQLLGGPAERFTAIAMVAGTATCAAALGFGLFRLSRQID